MAETDYEPALRYLLGLSSDIHAALLLGERGKLLAAAPGHVNDQVARLGADLLREARSLSSNGAKPVELDVSCNSGAVLLVNDGPLTLVCMADRQALPGLVFYDMYAVLADLQRGSTRPPAATASGEGQR